MNLTPHEQFAIDPHPFHDDEGQWYMFFAGDVLDADRPRTHLAVAPLASMTACTADPIDVLRPSADWQIYERDRPIYGGPYTWHTLEGPSVICRNGQYGLTYSPHRRPGHIRRDHLSLLDHLPNTTRAAHAPHRVRP